jgi:Ner family transcriptional regulator
MRKRPSATPGWSWNRIIFALRERGLTVSEVARRAGYKASSGRQVCTRRWPNMQRAIAGALDVAPQVLWPDRYDHEGVPVRKMPDRPKVDGSETSRRAA